MKIRTILMTTVIASLAMAFTAIETTEYKVDNTKSKITWIGRKVTGEHTGNINVSDGTLITDGKNITGGNFNIDMTSITCTDLKNGIDKKLVIHLKSIDFFDVDKHPRATLVINSVTPDGNDKYTVKGDLTIKGITKPIEFPAYMKVSKKAIAAKADITVDRTKYDIKYRSKSFAESLGDMAIDDNFTLKVDLVATK